MKIEKVKHEEEDISTRMRLVENKIRFISEERRDCSKCPGFNRYFCSSDFFGITNCYLLRNPEQTTLGAYGKQNRNKFVKLESSKV